VFSRMLPVPMRSSVIGKGFEVRHRVGHVREDE